MRHNIELCQGSVFAFQQHPVDRANAGNLRLYRLYSENGPLREEEDDESRGSHERQRVPARCRQHVGQEPVQRRRVVTHQGPDMARSALLNRGGRRSSVATTAAEEEEDRCRDDHCRRG